MGREAVPQGGRDYLESPYGITSNPMEDSEMRYEDFKAILLRVVLQLENEVDNSVTGIENREIVMEKIKELKDALRSESE